MSQTSIRKPNTVKSVRITKIERIGSADVYNMTVENNHNFVGNRVITHNCDALRYFAYTETYGRRRLYGLQNMASVVDD